LQGVTTTALLQPDGTYRINGSKTFITNGWHADLVILVAKTDPAAGAKGTSLFLIERGIPYEATHLSAAAPGESVGAGPSRSGVLDGVAEGWRWLAERPALAVFLTASLMPFVVVMAGNYLVPVYVTETLRAGPGTFAVSEVAFAVGAMCDQRDDNFGESAIVQLQSTGIEARTDGPRELQRRLGGI
jgi:hypothetical protein